MKTSYFLLTLLSTVTLLAQDPAPAPPAKSPDPTPATLAKPAPQPKALEFKFTVDELTATSITAHVKSGKNEVKSVNTVTDTTVVENNGTPAKFSDIKVGDNVSGLRLKTAENAYEIVKITAFATPKAKAK